MASVAYYRYISKKVMVFPFMIESIFLFSFYLMQKPAWCSTQNILKIHIGFSKVVFLQRVVCFLSLSLGEVMANIQLREFLITNLNDDLLLFFYCQISYRLYKPKNVVKVCEQFTPLHTVCNQIEIKSIFLHLHLGNIRMKNYPNCKNIAELYNLRYFIMKVIST